MESFILLNKALIKSLGFRSHFLSLLESFQSIPGDSQQNTRRSSSGCRVFLEALNIGTVSSPKQTWVDSDNRRHVSSFSKDPWHYSSLLFPRDRILSLSYILQKTFKLAFIVGIHSSLYSVNERFLKNWKNSCTTLHTTLYGLRIKKKWQMKITI